MGAGPFSSDSKTTQTATQINGQLTGSIAQIAGKKGKTVGNAALNLESGAALGGASLGNAKIAKGATVTITNTTSDNGAAAQAADLIQKAVTSQADTTAAALGSLGKLSETRETGGGNVIADVATKGFLALAGAIVIGIAIVLIARKKGG